MTCVPRWRKRPPTQICLLSATPCSILASSHPMTDGSLVPARGGDRECTRHTRDGRGRVACLGPSGPAHPPHPRTSRNGSQLLSRRRRGLDDYPRTGRRRGRGGGGGGGGRGERRRISQADRLYG